MSNPSKAKGTGGETEFRLELNDLGIVVKRTPASSIYDLEREGPEGIEVLATRPDRGEWLVTMRLADFALLQRSYDADGEERGLPLTGLRIEVKRYARFALHAIFQKKFGRTK